MNLQELVVGGQVFPFVAHEQTQHTEVLRFKGSGSSAKAAELGTVSHKLQLQVCQPCSSCLSFGG